MLVRTINVGNSVYFLLVHLRKVTSPPFTWCLNRATPGACHRTRTMYSTTTCTAPLTPGTNLSPSGIRCVSGSAECGDLICHDALLPLHWPHLSFWVWVHYTHGQIHKYSARSDIILMEAHYCMAEQVSLVCHQS